ncbi:hypothetical protein R1flu_007093 [Riccia fluitans]|uniref:Uncharacterized protein n=1 Tax=Riccia fluitans TaxID=41844 RepID=A0ABD1YXW9_9MARC
MPSLSDPEGFIRRSGSRRCTLLPAGLRYEEHRYASPERTGTLQRAWRRKGVAGEPSGSTQGSELTRLNAFE